MAQENQVNFLEFLKSKKKLQKKPQKTIQLSSQNWEKHELKELDFSRHYLTTTNSLHSNKKSGNHFITFQSSKHLF